MTQSAVVRDARTAPASTTLSLVRFALIAIVLAGVVLRFVNLDAKSFSFDEATTSIRVAGYTLDGYGREAFGGRAIPNSDFTRYQHVRPGHTMGDAVASLANEDPQHPPLYYMLERGWSQIAGNSVAQRRVVSAAAGSLALAAAVWLGIELAGSLTAGLLFAALLAVSPFFVIYSQQAREYSLWELLTLVAGALLLRAMRTNRALDWAGFGIASALGLYADLLFLYVLAGFVVYAGVSIAREGRRRWLPFALAAGGAVVAFAPWLVAVERGRALLTNNDYLSIPIAAKVFALKWIFNSGAVFFDLDYERIALGVVLVPIFALLAYAAVDCVRSQPLRVWLFVATLGLVTTAALVLPDLVAHSSRSTAPRYLLPTWLGFELAVALLIARLAALPGARQRTFAWAAFAALIVCGGASVIHDSPRPTSWAEGKSIAGLAPMSSLIGRTSQPLVVFVNDPQRFDFTLLALSNTLAPDVRVLQQNFGAPVALPHFGTVFLIDPTARVRAALTHAGHRLTLVYSDRATTVGPAALQSLRAETARARAAQGEEIEGLSLWTIGDL